MNFITYRKLEKKAWSLVAEKAGSEMRYDSIRFFAVTAFFIMRSQR